MAEANEAKRAKRNDPQLAEFEKWCCEKAIKISPKVRVYNLQRRQR